MSHDGDLPFAGCEEQRDIGFMREPGAGAETGLVHRMELEEIVARRELPGDLPLYVAGSPHHRLLDVRPRGVKRGSENPAQLDLLAEVEQLRASAEIDQRGDPLDEIPLSLREARSAPAG